MILAFSYLPLPLTITGKPLRKFNKTSGESIKKKYENKYTEYERVTIEIRTKFTSLKRQKYPRNYVLVKPNNSLKELQ